VGERRGCWGRESGALLPSAHAMLVSMHVSERVLRGPLFLFTFRESSEDHVFA
jgi:hypothetical protein